MGQVNVVHMTQAHRDPKRKPKHVKPSCRPKGREVIIGEIQDRMRERVPVERIKDG
jgi:hypothetical protein